jgi:hypothetical protein
MLADTLDVEQRYRWSSTDLTNFNIDHSRAQAITNRKSLRIATTAATAGGDNALYGVSGTPVDKTDIMNAFGNDVNDLTWCTDLACWLYHTDDVYSGGDPDQFKFVITDNDTDIDVYWPSTFDTVDKWIWATGTPDAGSFAANGDNIEQWGFKGTAGFTASSYFYINGFVAYRTTLSTDSHDYTHTNGINLGFSSSYIPTGWNTWRVTGNLIGSLDTVPTPSEPRLYDLERQLHSMQTLGLSRLQGVRSPTPKYQALMDCDNIKTYLMLQTENLGVKGASYVTNAVPGIITNVTTEWVAPSKNLLAFSFDFSRFAGV